MLLHVLISSSLDNAKVIKPSHTSIWCGGEECVDPYLHFPLRLHGAMLNETQVAFYFYVN
jgi:hypothetical protein